MEESYIPMDIVTEEILCYLPVKSLARFRCVSKSWKRKISETRFIRRHLKQQAERKRLLLDYEPASQRYFSSTCLSFIESLSKSDEVAAADSVTDILFPFEDRPFCALVLAICDELWLVERDSPPSLCLYNPSMRAYRELPDKPPTWMDILCDRRWIGVGYDSDGDDYKVFMAPFKFLESDYEGQQLETHLYSLRNDCWRKIGDCSATFESTYCEPKRGAPCLNGVLHWVVSPLSDFINIVWDYAIICFDLSVERYVELPRPPSYPILASGYERVVHTSVSVAVLKGMLCVALSYMDSEPQQLVLWAMKEYGVAESWTRMHQISYDAHHPILPPRYTRILYMFDNQHLLILTDRHIVVYQDDHTPLCNKIVRPSRRCRRSPPLYGFIYVESLVLTGDGPY